ncbi:MAG: efflux RND transporter permease subunit, partial [Gammaproteobacteria bacterium]|nr:efflux RND transporter permease subunit [Gammaproteobacteria bacterium]
ALQQAGANIPGGHVNSEDKRFTVRLSGDYKDLDEIRRTVVAAREGHLVYLEDLASIRQTDGIPSYLARFNGEPAVFISVMQRKGSNIFDIMTGLKQQIAQFESTLPGSMRIDVVMDQTNSVSERIDGFFNSLLQGLVLVGVMTLLVLGFRASLVIVLAIPLSVMIGIGWVDMAGFGLQQMTIVGLVIALGLLVDNAIVVTENVGRLLRQGVPHQEAAERGAAQVGWAVTSGTLTTILSFFPILLLPNDSGTFMRSMPVTVVVTLFASLLLALTLTPLLASRWLKRVECKVTQTPQQGTWLHRGLDRLSRGPYAGSLTVAIRHPWLTLLGAVLILLGTLSLAAK